MSLISHIVRCVGYRRQHSLRGRFAPSVFRLPASGFGQAETVLGHSNSAIGQPEPVLGYSASVLGQAEQKLITESAFRLADACLWLVRVRQELKERGKRVRG